MLINGVGLPLVGLVERACALQRAFADLSMEIIDEGEASNGSWWCSGQRGRHVGPPVLHLGEIAPTSRHVEVRTLDVLSISADRISAIQVGPDNLGLAMQLGAVALAQQA